MSGAKDNVQSCRFPLPHTLSTAPKVAWLWLGSIFDAIRLGNNNMMSRCFKFKLSSFKFQSCRFSLSVGCCFVGYKKIIILILGLYHESHKVNNFKFSITISTFHWQNLTRFVHPSKYLAVVWQAMAPVAVLRN